MLEDDEGAEADHEEEEEEDVGEGAGVVVKEPPRVVEEDALQSQLVRVEPEHREDDHCQHEAENGDCQLPAVVVAEKSASGQEYLDCTTSVSTPSAISVMMASTWAMCGAKRGKMRTMANQIRPSPKAVTTVDQKAFW